MLKNVLVFIIMRDDDELNFSSLEKAAKRRIIRNNIKFHVKTKFRSKKPYSNSTLFVLLARVWVVCKSSYRRFIYFHSFDIKNTKRIKIKFIKTILGIFYFGCFRSTNNETIIINSFFNLQANLNFLFIHIFCCESFLDTSTSLLKCLLTTLKQLFFSFFVVFDKEKHLQ